MINDLFKFFYFILDLGRGTRPDGTDESTAMCLDDNSCNDVGKYKVDKETNRLEEDLTASSFIDRFQVGQNIVITGSSVKNPPLSWYNVVKSWDDKIDDMNSAE
jgi:hypothetical protein